MTKKEAIIKIKEKIKDIEEIKVEILVQKALNYMNRKDFPEDLVLILVEALQSNSNNSNEHVKSMTVGDTKIEYQAKSSDDIIGSIKAQLNRFRKVGVLC